MEGDYSGLTSYITAIKTKASRNLSTAKVSAWGVASAFLFVVGVATLFGFAGGVGWIFDLASNFRPQYFTASVLLTVAFALKRRRGLALTSGVMAMINASVIAPIYISNANLEVGANERIYRAILVNAHTANRQFGRVKAFLESQEPDFVLILEVDDRWTKGLDGVRQAMPHYVEQAREDNFGIAFYSKLPLDRCEILDLGSAEVPSIIAELKLNDLKLSIIGTHPLPPGSKDTWEMRNDQLRELSLYVQKLPGHTAILGDLNVTPWSIYLKRVLTTADLHDARRGFGVKATWPSFLGLFGIPIDHCLVSKGIRIKNVQVGRRLGSDHAPLVVDFVVGATEPGGP